MSIDFARKANAGSVAKKILAAMRHSPDPKAIIPEALKFATDAGNFIREAIAICAHVLAKAGFEKQALAWWDKSAGNYPHNRAWLEAAMRLAWEAKVPEGREYAEKWLPLVDEVFISTPRFAFLRELAERGWRGKGSMGAHVGRLKAWLWADAGEKFNFSIYPAVENMGAGMVLRGRDDLYSLYEINLPLESIKTDIALSITDGNGRHIKGSPLVVSPPRVASGAYKRIEPPRGGLTVLIPVYANRDATLRCLGCVFASLKKNRTPARILVAWDSGPDKRLDADLCRLARKGRITLLKTPMNMGFLGAVNFAIRHVPQGDVLLLNSDTLVHGNWIDRLACAGKAKEDAATITALGSNAEHMSFPAWDRRGKITTLKQTALLDNACAGIDAENAVMEIPVGVGFCMLITRRAINAIGLLDGREVCRGYSEEVDYGLRAKEAGLANYGAYNVYVAHLGGKSFGAAKTALAAQNNAAVFRRFPKYRGRYHIFLQNIEAAQIREKISRNALAKLALPAELHIYPANAKYLADWEAGQDGKKSGFHSLALFASRKLAVKKAVLCWRGEIALADMEYNENEFAQLGAVLRRAGVNRAVLRGARLEGFAQALGLAFTPYEPPRREKLAPVPAVLEPGNYLVLPPDNMKAFDAFYRLAAANPFCDFFAPALNNLWSGAREAPNIHELPQAEDLTPFSFLAILGYNEHSLWRNWLLAHCPQMPPFYGAY